MKFLIRLVTPAALAVLVLGCSTKSEAPVQKETVFPVKVAKVELQNVPIVIESIGHISSIEETDVKPQVSGKIVAAFINGGEDIRSGDFLYKIDPEPFEIALDKARSTLVKDEAVLIFFKSRLLRYSKLVKGEFVAPLTVEEYERDVSTQEAQVLLDRSEVALAELNLGYTNILAPMHGRLSLDVISLGNLVTPSDSKALTTIVQLSPIYVEFTLTQQDFQSVKRSIAESRRLDFEVLLMDESKGFQAELDGIENILSTQTGTIKLRGIIPNKEKILWPGEYVRVRFPIRELKNIPVVPYSAVQIGQKGNFVYVLKEDQTVDVVPVKSGEHFGNSIVVEEGLTEGMIVVTEGQLNLRQGVKVSIADDPKKVEL